MRRALFSLLTAAVIVAVAGPTVAGPTVASPTVTGPTVAGPTLVATAVADTASAAVTAISTRPRFESSAPSAVWHNGGFLLNNNEWNPSAGPQTIWVYSDGSWGVRSDQPVGLAVQTYPCVQQYYNNVPVSSFHLIRNGFTESMPDAAGLDAEAADDVWLNHYGIEVMIWVDNHGRTPAGKITSYAWIFGQYFAVWRSGSIFTFVLNHNETSGETHILASLQWLMEHRYVPAGATLTQVNFGWEVASTDGRPMDFAMTSYWLHS